MIHLAWLLHKPQTTKLPLDHAYELIEAGDYEGALAVVNHTLNMASTNIEALKLKAWFLEQKGEFCEAHTIWGKIGYISPQDEDAINYEIERSLEHRSMFYWVDALEGGYKFITWPKFGFFEQFGLFIWLFFIITLYNFGLVIQPIVIASFVATVVIPWITAILKLAIKPNSISITKNGVVVSALFGKLELTPWDKIEVFRMYDYTNLSIIFVFNGTYISVNMDKATTAIRGRLFFIKQLSLFKKSVSITNDSLKNLLYCKRWSL